MRRSRKLRGLYLVVSEILPDKELLLATEMSLDGGVDLLQYSAGTSASDRRRLAQELANLANNHDIPFLINNDLQLAKEVEANGVHFDTFEIRPESVWQALGEDSLVGYTVNVSLEKLWWAEKAGADYVSFCSIFHECEVAQCPIVSLETVKEARASSNLSMFGAGGVTLENAHLVLEAGANGVAVTSALLKSKNPQETAKSFKEIIRRYLNIVS